MENLKKGMVSLFLPPYSPFLNPNKGLIFLMEVDDQMSLLDTINAGCLDISA